jgi:hypothetical protein
MLRRQDFRSAREEERRVFARFMIVLGYLRVMLCLRLIQMALVILVRIYLKKSEMMMISHVSSAFVY